MSFRPGGSLVCHEVRHRLTTGTIAIAGGGEIQDAYALHRQPGAVIAITGYRR